MLSEQLFHLGKEYPGGRDYFHSKLKNAFMKNAHLTDPKAIDEAIGRGQFVVKEVEALWVLFLD